MNDDSAIVGEDVLAAEYEYIAQTAFQAQEDRARVTTFFLVSVGSLFGVFFGSPGTPSATMYGAFAGLFLFVSWFGIITLQQLIRLRYAWFESVYAMNQIKDFLISHNKDLKKAFRWTNKTLPQVYKRNSVAYYLALQVAMLGAVTFSAMIFYACLAIGKHFGVAEKTLASPILIAGAITGGLIFLRYQMYFYRHKLK
ncbi:MAG: hypothetical protein L3J16_05040 [Anaerolineales bacterium]|nr:hypothetical protein [Anaerolineales bacterium]